MEKNMKIIAIRFKKVTTMKQHFSAIRTADKIWGEKE